MSKDLSLWKKAGTERGAYWAARWNAKENRNDLKAFSYMQNRIEGADDL